MNPARRVVAQTRRDHSDGGYTVRRSFADGSSIQERFSPHGWRVDVGPIKVMVSTRALCESYRASRSRGTKVFAR